MCSVGSSHPAALSCGDCGSAVQQRMRWECWLLWAAGTEPGQVTPPGRLRPQGACRRVPSINTGAAFKTVEKTEVKQDGVLRWHGRETGVMGF